MRILLINSGNDAGIGDNANAASWPPLNIISLGTAIQNAFADAVRVTLIDGQIEPIEHIVASLTKTKPDVVGISMYATSIENTVRIAREAKGVGAITVVGNDHACFHHRILLERIQEIDYICLNDVGEDTLVPLVGSLLGRAEINKVPMMALRDKGGQVVHTSLSPIRPRDKYSLNRTPIPDRDLLDDTYWAEYLSAFRRQCHKRIDPQGATGVSTINRARGCAGAGRRCRYCGIADLTLRGSSAQVFWEDVRQARTQVKANYLYEVFDSATSWPTLIRQWADAKPDGLSDARFFLYAQAKETDEDIVQLFSELGVYCVNRIRIHVARSRHIIRL